MSANIKAELLDRHRINSVAWDALVANSPQGANYGMSWYLDVVWPGWQGIHVYNKGDLQAVMPVRVSRKFGLRYCYQPALSQYTGIFFGEMAGKIEKVLSEKKQLTTAAIAALPKGLAHFVVNFAPEFDCPMPFHWAGYELRTRYSQWLDNGPDKASIFKNFNERTRTYINKATKSGLVPSEVTDIGAIMELGKSQSAYPLDHLLLAQLWEALRERGAARAVETRDAGGRLHAGLVYQVAGKKQVHLFSAKDPVVAASGGMSLAIWHSIRTAGDDIAINDFEGSMLEPVEHFFRGFGTRPVPYLQIRKNHLPKPLRWVIE